MTDFTHTAKGINDILVYLRDSQRGFAECIKETRNIALKTLFENLKHQRSIMIKKLEDLVRNLGEEPTQHTSIAGTLHRIYIDLKSLLTQNNTQSIVEEIKRGESILMEAYGKVLQDEKTDPTTKEILQQELIQIRQVQSQIERVVNSDEEPHQL